LEAYDGHRLMAYFARAEKPTGRGIVVLHDGYGYRDYYKELARNFAMAGVEAVAIDLYARTARDNDGPRDETWEPFREHMAATTPESVATDVAAGVAFLRSREGGASKEIFTLGFCFTGAHSWRQSAVQDGLAGCIGMYGGPDGVRDVIPRMRAPLLVIVAGADRIPVEKFREFGRELVAGGVRHRIVVYDGAPHSFFDVKFEQWKDVCNDAWRQMLDFMARPVAA
jgi:carboxymethylenebutenolidase